MNEGVAKRLQVLVDGKKCIANEVAIVRRTKKGSQWVYLSLVDSCGKVDKYLVDRYNMVQAWIGLETGVLCPDISKMQVEVNGEKWIARRARSVSIDNKDFVQLEIEKDGTMRTVAIDRAGLVKAYYSLRSKIEDIVVDGVEAIAGVLGI